MATKDAAHRARTRPLNIVDAQADRPNRDPAFPLSSPPIENVTALKPSTGPGSLVSKNPFFPSNPFASSSSDDDSGGSSGQDEFHLERYSQDAKSVAQTPQSRRQRSLRRPPKRSDRKPRPGLNIVTNFSTQSTRSQTDGLVIEKVHAQRPQLGPRYATSVVSAKAEHVGHSGTETILGHGNLVDAVVGHKYISDGPQRLPKLKRSVGGEVVSRLQEWQAAGKKARANANANNTQLGRSQINDKATTETDGSPQARSIVIGLSVPEHEADARRATNGGDSAVSGPTPDTPAIVVTPADETEFGRPRFLGEPRPPSSIYSAVPRNEPPPLTYDTPPVPKIPRAHANQNGTEPVTAGAVVVRTMSDGRPHYARGPKVDDEKGLDFADGAPRNSCESQMPILPSGPDHERPRSQGWWNLMLSPMLSRKGTVVEKGGARAVETPPLPSGPAAVTTPHTIFNAPVSPESPETPRRLGLASARASVWSRWTSWERERERAGSKQTNKQAQPSDTIKQQETSHNFKDTPSKPATYPSSDGLAAEYYHACAVEQLSGVQYFECQNHSCTEGLPRLQSVFDPNSSPGVSTAANEAGRSVGDAAGDGNVPLSPKARVQSEVTIRTEPAELSPNVRQADTAAVMKARSIETPDMPGNAPGDPSPKASPTHVEAANLQSAQPTPDPEPRHVLMQYPNIATVVPPHVNQPPVMSPGPVSPAMQRTMASQGAVPMTEMQQNSGHAPFLDHGHTSTQPATPGQIPPPLITIHQLTTHADRPPYEPSPRVTEARVEHTDSRPGSVRQLSRPAPQRDVASKATGQDSSKKSSILSMLKCLGKRKLPVEGDNATAKKWPWTLIISIPLFLIVLTCLLLAIFLTRTGTDTPVQSQWLNLTGYPPIPTGISTIARPDAVRQQSQCVAPTTLWSCALPKESQADIAPNNADQPNFRFEITFRNGTVPTNMTIPVGSVSRRSSGVERRASDPFTNDLFEPNPTPPSRADQIFMGNTTDNTTQPFEGEQTPFFITFIPVFPIDPSNTTSSSSKSSRLRTRQATNSSDSIPAPDVLDDGSAAPANLLPTSPYPTSQPIKLYNRGQTDEHYGFYMYYDKAIFLKSTAPLNTSEFSNNAGIDPADENGGATREQSRLRCTLSQTRFLVKVWTNAAFGATLLSPTSENNGTNGNGTVSSATDFNRPGSFPYPTTLSLDRHGGNINKKAVYCYGVDDLQVIQTDVKSIVPEARGVGGTLINPAPPLVNGSIDAGNDSFDQDAGGIDGGTGGCECVWQNWN
ncbi:hypothetical protein A1O3_09088 [Capronia epimyces CBS 606.96]|uniref:Glycoprotease family protein n=1 Tax=Capronia epimyces CBS 606.96 TaxID=1182542 RepID=W9Y688_9EURO|nr:uncharacterized protein A1O3_09088 [Capronia epimyces CBS 606.96]EXJ77929.1 hypothetical protein A1O3_09088 [Capronia epimyces CBS 606.96]